MSVDLIASGATSQVSGHGAGHVPGCTFHQQQDKPHGSKKPNPHHGCCFVNDKGAFQVGTATHRPALMQQAPCAATHSALALVHCQIVHHTEGQDRRGRRREWGQTMHTSRTWAAGSPTGWLIIG